MSSNQNNSNEESNAVPANEQNELPDIEQNELPNNEPQPLLESEHASSPEAPLLILETEPPMEVHAHTHTPRKKWTHYLWEFLMLFLAVFCGFLAENQREHMVEHRREKEYMASMLNDIKADTARLSLMHRAFTNVVAHIDSLTILLKSNDAMDKNAAAIYQHQVTLNLFAKLIYSDRTISQLKNSGNFRLIREKLVSDKIIDYDGYVVNYIGTMQDEYILPLWRKVTDESNDIFQAVVFREYFKKGQWTDHPIELPEKPYFISEEKARRLQFANVLNQYAVALEWGNININNALSRAVNLDSLIRKEYHLK